MPAKVQRGGNLVNDVVKYLAAAIALFTAVKKLVEEFEVPGYGPEKKQAVLDALASLYDAGRDWIPMEKEKVLSLASALIEIIVQFNNIVGIFKHRPKEPAPSGAAKG